MVDRLTGLFEEHRPRLWEVGYRMLGSDDAVQEAWIRLTGRTPVTWPIWVAG